MGNMGDMRDLVKKKIFEPKEKLSEKKKKKNNRITHT